MLAKLISGEGDICRHFQYHSDTWLIIISNEPITVVNQLWVGIWIYRRIQQS
jgi:hypothetical protein